MESIGFEIITFLSEKICILLLVGGEFPLRKGVSSMSIKQFEVFHGIALTKLLRSDKPVSVRLIETKPAEDWQIYAINDIDLFAKHRAISNPLVCKKGGYSWQFVFSPSEVSRII